MDFMEITVIFHHVLQQKKEEMVDKGSKTIASAWRREIEQIIGMDESNIMFHTLQLRVIATSAHCITSHV